MTSIKRSVFDLGYEAGYRDGFGWLKADKESYPDFQATMPSDLSEEDEAGWLQGYLCGQIAGRRERERKLKDQQGQS